MVHKNIVVLVILLVFILIVLVAAFGIISILIMVVIDKTADIAILKTMGARARSIMGIFMINGQVIGINEFFLTKGDFQPEGAERPLVVTGNRSHPPYHDGCDCGIGPG